MKPPIKFSDPHDFGFRAPLSATTIAALKAAEREVALYARQRPRVVQDGPESGQ